MTADVFSAERKPAQPAPCQPVSGRPAAGYEEEYAMKRTTTIIIGAGLLAASSLANAAGQLAPVKVHGNTQAIADCAPPNDSKQCADFHAAIRKSFSTR